MRDPKGRMVSGYPSENWAPVGTERIRTRRKRGGEQRVFVKVAEPNAWKLRAQVVWEAAHGDIPRGMVIHHKDENKLHDAVDNLELLSKSGHLKEHRAGFNDRRKAAFAEARRAIRWSTKSATKRTGAPPKHGQAELDAARAAIGAGMNPNAASALFGVSRTTCYRLKTGAR